jgi:serine/threonine protein kinase
MTGPLPANVGSSADLGDVPEIVGAYRVRKAIAAGGMAAVFLATEVAPPHAVVALKRILPHLAKEQGFVDMFHDEARIASQIEHPNVCRVLDFGTDSVGVPYMSMEFLVGEPMTALLRELASNPALAKEPRWPAFVARIVAESALGLHAAHELRGPDGELRRVVHRDVSPQNLFIGFDGVVKVVDFGIASATHRIHQTRTGELKGKFGYMAPESVRGLGAIDRRADVWALGIVLWESLTLKRLFRRKSDGETLIALLEGTIPRPSELVPGLPTSLDAIVLGALERDPEKRFATAEELAQALASWLWDVNASVGTSDLASWMLRCFPKGPAASAEMLRAIDAGDVVDREIADEAAVDDGATVVGAPPSMTSAPPPPNETEAAMSSTAPAPGVRTRARVVLGVALFVALLLLAVAIVLRFVL